MKPDIPSGTLHECNKFMFDHGLSFDTVFAFPSSAGRPREVQAHKYVLMSRSPVFYAMLCGPLKMSDQVIVVEDISVNAFREILRFLYYEEVCLDEENVSQVLYGANKYLLPHLVAECENYLSVNISVDNVCDILQMSVLFELECVKKKCLKFIQNKAHYIISSESFLTIDQSALLEVLKLNVMSVSEADLFTACMEWLDRKILSQAQSLASSDTIHQKSPQQSLAISPDAEQMQQNAITRPDTQQWCPPTLGFAKQNVLYDIIPHLCLGDIPNEVLKEHGLEPDVIESYKRTYIQENAHIKERCPFRQKKRMKCESLDTQCPIASRPVASTLLSSHVYPLDVNVSHDIYLHSFNVFHPAQSFCVTATYFIEQNAQVLARFSSQIPAKTKDCFYGSTWTVPLPKSLKICKGTFTIAVLYRFVSRHYGTVFTSSPPGDAVECGGGATFWFPGDSISSFASFNFAIAEDWENEDSLQCLVEHY